MVRSDGFHLGYIQEIKVSTQLKMLKVIVGAIVCCVSDSSKRRMMEFNVVRLKVKQTEAFKKTQVSSKIL